MANTALVPKAILPFPLPSAHRFLARVFDPTVNRSRALPSRRKEKERGGERGEGDEATRRILPLSKPDRSGTRVDSPMH